MKTFNEALDEIMDWFDFELAFKVLQNVPGCWLNYKEAPCVGDIRVFARDYLKQAYERALKGESGRCQMGTGCFEFICVIEDGDVYLELKCVPCEWNYGN